jgi:hypothetical protein
LGARASSPFHFLAAQPYIPKQENMQILRDLANLQAHTRDTEGFVVRVDVFAVFAVLCCAVRAYVCVCIVRSCFYWKKQNKKQQKKTPNHLTKTHTPQPQIAPD